MSDNPLPKLSSAGSNHPHAAFHPPVVRLPNYVGPEQGRAQSMLHPGIGLLVADLCAALEPVPTVLKRYGVNRSQFQALLAQPVFRQALKQQRQLFQSMSNLPDRIRLKAQLAIEDLLQDMYTLAAGVNVPAAARVAAFNQIKNLTGLEKPEAPTPKQKFALTINVSAPSGNGSADEITLITENVNDAVEEGAEALSEEDAQSVLLANNAIQHGWHANTARPVGTLRNSPQPVNILNKVTSR